LHVGANAALDGTLQLIPVFGFQPLGGEQLQVVSAASISGRFSNLIDPFPTGPGYDTIDLVYGQGLVQVDFIELEFVKLPEPIPPFISTIDFSSFAQTPNQLAAANMLDAVQLDPRATELMTFLNNEPFANLPGDFDKISPEALTAFYEIGFSNANIQKLSLERLRLHDRWSHFRRRLPISWRSE
jgi:hypothetical protein